MKDRACPQCAPWYHRWTLRRVGWRQKRLIYVCTRCGAREDDVMPGRSALQEAGRDDG